VTANDAAAIAIQLFRLDARLCDQHPMKVARTTNNPSVSGNTLYEATTSLACSSNTIQDTLRISHDASVQTNPCTVFQVNPVHTTDLSKSLSDAQITQTTSTSSQTNGEGNSSSLKVVSVEQPMAKEHKIQSVVPVESMAQNQDGTSAQAPKENDENVLKDMNLMESCEQSGSNDNQPLKNDILERLDVASLSVPDCMLHDVHNVDSTLMEAIKKPLKYIASFQTGNYFNILNVFIKYYPNKYFILNLILKHIYIIY